MHTDQQKSVADETIASALKELLGSVDALYGMRGHIVEEGEQISPSSGEMATGASEGL